jgi:hypothetical protein
VSCGKNKDSVCPAFAELVRLLSLRRSGRTIETVQSHVKFCPRCAFALGLLRQLLRDEVTLEEKALLDSIGSSKQARQFRRFAKNLS